MFLIFLPVLSYSSINSICATLDNHRARCITIGIEEQHKFVVAQIACLYIVRILKRYGVKMDIGLGLAYTGQKQEEGE